MPLSFDPTGDFALVTDGLTPITLRRRFTLEEYAGIQALRRAVTIREAQASNGLYTTQDVRWHFETGAVNPAPSLGDVIYEDGQDQLWTVLAVETATLRTRYACVCRNLAIVHHLDTLLTIKRPSYTKDSYGAETATLSLLHQSVSGRIQPERADELREEGRDQLDRVWRVFVDNLPDGTQYQPRRNDVIENASGTYRVIGFEFPEQVGELLHVICESA